jgi:phytol kinase
MVDKNLAGNIMSNDLTGSVLTSLIVVLLIGVVTVLEKVLKLSKETTRKLVHIGAGHALFLMYAFIQSKYYAAGVMILFVVLNYVSLKSNLFATMETKERKTMGTVYYPIAMVFQILWLYDIDRAALGAGVLAMAWGDGCAAVFGSKYGKTKYRPQKSVEGSAAAFLFSFLSILIYFITYIGYDPLNAAKKSLLCAMATTFIEGLTQGDKDNLLVPLGVSALCHYLL